MSFMHPMNKVRVLLLSALITGILFLSAGCSISHDGKTQTAFAFDTVISVTWFNDRDENAVSSVLSRCQSYEKIFSRTDPESELYALNHSEGNPFYCSEDLYCVLETALSYCRLTDGRFDISFGGVSELYGFSDETHCVPSEAALQDRLSHTGYEKIHSDPETHSVTVDDPELIIDLGAVAKGYIADQMKSQLEEAGVTSAIINLGGNILLIGSKPDGSPFKIGIQYPEGGRSESITTVTLTDQAVATSGTYQRCFTQDGVTYHHLLDTSTGKPLQNGLLSVSIIAPDAMTADALSTAVFALGKKDGQALLASPGLKGIFIHDDFSAEHYPPSFETQ